MLSKDYVTKLINLEGVIFKDIYIQGDEVRIFVAKQHCVELCPTCGILTTQLVDVIPKVYRDIDLLNRICYIEIDQRRYECRNCFCTFTEKFSFTEAYRHYTTRFENSVYECVRETTASYAAIKFGISDHTAQDIYQRIALQKLENQKFESPVQRIGIDEIAMHKGHKDFVLVISDLSNKRVIDVLKDRKKETLSAYLNGWSEELKAGVETVAIDLWGPYRSCAEEILPNAKVVADRFHVMQNLNKALDDCRKREKKNYPDQEIWKNTKYTLLKNREDLSDEQEGILNKVLNLSSALRECYNLKEQFRKIFNQSNELSEARDKLYNWILQVIRSEMNGYYDFVKTLLNWEENILHYFLDRISSGFVEGVNNKIKLIKRKAFGFRNFENFRIKIRNCFC
jgi:transposase